MVAYSFRPQFVDPILSGVKCQTIRADRRRHTRPGEEVQIYTGMRTKHCRLIGRATCLWVHRIVIDLTQGMINIDDGHTISNPDPERFAVLDGFSSWEEMREFWRCTHGPFAGFQGVLIRWGGFKRGDTYALPV